MTSPSILSRLVRGLYATAAAIACIALAGWATGQMALTHALPGYPAMNPLTALCTLLLAGAGWIRSMPARPRLAACGTALTAAVVAVTAARVAGLLLGRDVPVDLVAFADRVLHAPISARMGVHSSLALLAMGSGLLTLDLQSARGWRVSDGLLLAALGIATAGLVGYLYAAPPMHGLMSIHTAVAVPLLVFAMLLMRPDRGLCGLVLEPSSGGVMARRVLPIATLVPVVLGWLRLEAQRRGYVQLEIGTAFLVLAIAGLMIGLVWMTGRTLESADRQRAQAADALRRSILRQNQMADLNLIGVLTTDRHGMIVDANRAFLEMTGFARSDLPLNAFEITPPEWRGHTAQALADLAHHGSITPFEKEYLRKDGSRIPVLVGAAGLPDDPDHVLAFVVDLTTKRAAELELGRLQMFLDSIVENLPNMVFVKDARDLKFVRLNRAGEELLGVSREAVLGKSDYDFFPHAEADFFTAKDREVLARGRMLDIPEEPIQTAHGERVLHTKKVPILDQDGTPRYLLGISEDITEHKCAERERAELHEGLRQRTLELEAANQELEAFSYSVSHDLRAPLRHVDGFSDLLARHARETLDEKGRRYLDSISSAAKSMGRLIDDLLAFSRMSRSQMQTAQVDLGSLVTEIRRELDRDAGGREVEWRVASLPQVEGDRAMLRLVFVNLLANAHKYSRGRERSVIEVGSESTDAETIVHVRDNGVGFDMKYLNKLFGVFQRLHRDDEFEGTGIGLATVRRIVHRHGGRAWAEGAIDRGATFYVAFPRTPETSEIREAA